MWRAGITGFVFWTRALRLRDLELFHWWQAEFPVQDLRLCVMCCLSYTTVLYFPGACFGISRYYQKGTALLEAQNPDLIRSPATAGLCAGNSQGEQASSLPSGASFPLWAAFVVQSSGREN